MLIEFSVANFRSFRDRQHLSLAMAVGAELVDTNTFKVSIANEFELLRSAAIYGPNAGGKSNLLAALKGMQQVVLNSTARQRGYKLPVVPFRLSEKTSQAPSEFEVTMVAADQVRYQYGFTATAERIHEEWLIAYPKGRPQRWFDRKWDDENQRYNWVLGGNLLGEKQVWQKSTRDNALFLSTAVQLNSQQLQPVYDWFHTTLRMGSVGGWDAGFSASLCEKEEKAKILDFLRAADLNIEDILIQTEPFDPKKLPDDMPQAFKNEIAKELKDKQLLNIKTVHKTVDGNLVEFNFEEDESDGTRRLFSFAGPWIASLANGHVLFVDELHDNLHPKLVQFLVELFHNSETNPKNAQLVFTTHETSILSQEVFRRDQIWFCEKDESQTTLLYPLTEFSPRKSRENLELAYLSGRYGALPYIRELKKTR